MSAYTFRTSCALPISPVHRWGVARFQGLLGSRLDAGFQHHQKCQKNVHTSKNSGKSRRTRLSKNSVDCSSDGRAVREILWVFRALHLSARPVLGAYGHHHQNCQKIVRASESSRKSRTRLSKNSVDCISDGGVVREIWWVFRAFLPAISYACTGRFRPPPPQLPAKRAHIREQRKAKGNKLI